MQGSDLIFRRKDAMRGSVQLKLEALQGGSQYVVVLRRDRGYVLEV